MSCRMEEKASCVLSFPVLGGLIDETHSPGLCTNSFLAWAPNPFSISVPHLSYRSSLKAQSRSKGTGRVHTAAKTAEGEELLPAP